MLNQRVCALRVKPRRMVDPRILAYLLPPILTEYENTTYAADPIQCHDCRKSWGWRLDEKPQYGRVPFEKFACCNKALDK